MATATHDELVHDLSIYAPDAADWCLEHSDDAKRLTDYALREFPSARRSALTGILRLAAHVAERRSVDAAIAAMAGVAA